MVRNMLRAPQARGFGLGLGVALLGYVLWPALKLTMRPAARGLVKGALITAHRTGRVIAEAREELEDLFAEARYEAHAVAPTPGVTDELSSE